MATALQPSAVLVGRPALAHGIVDVAAALGIPIVVNVPSIQRWVVDGVPRFAEDVTAALYACLRRADRVVAVADHVAADLADMGVRTVTTIPNGVDLQQFRPAPPDRSLQKSLHLGDDDIVVLHASNLKPMKHALDLVRSAAPALGRDRRLRYLIIGEGPDRAEMERTAHSLGIADHFRFVGQVEHLQIPDYVRLADLAIMPSVTEGMCISYLEAMACEKVLLASDIPGARELVDDGETGLLFPFGDIGAIADKTVALAADVEERQRIGKNGRTKVARDHVIETTVASYCGLIETVIENGPTRKLR